MPNWTKEQLKAITQSGTNILVSAGAGSGKTAVLTERVITKLKNGTSIQKLLILTFTNAAASEMKSRIRKSISDIKELKKELDYIDSSYITTFDSFSMSLVKKYNYALNVSKNISVVDKTVCDTIRDELLDNIFENMYDNQDEDFSKTIKDLCLKDDIEIKKSIKSINEKLDRLINKEEYLDNYINSYYSIENIDKLYNEFINYMFSKIKRICELTKNIYNYAETGFYDKVVASVEKLINSTTYNQVKLNIKVSLPRLPNNSSDELKEAKSLLSEEITSLGNILIYKDEQHIKNTLLSTKPYASTIIKIVKELDKKLNEYKSIKDVYEFNDIAKMAIKLVKENNNIREEITSSFDEIMLDEYQDTSDLQEELISMISNNNVYMVGDIKQSIYRFRNANPNIFRSKYENYSKGINGIKIDLLDNFRSRKETIEDINKIFSLIMDTHIGGADYKTSHIINFGNKLYEEENPTHNKNLEVYTYDRNDKKYKYSEYEAFIIAEDINKKINTKYQVLDKDTKKLRDARYEDFCILIDRGTSFELYKKIFEYLSIPLVIYYDEKITEEKDLLIIHNLIDMIIKIRNNKLDTKFKYDLYSILRSYISNTSDQEYADMFINNNFKENEIYKTCLSISYHLDTLSSSELIDEIMDRFNFYEKAITEGDIEKFIVRIDYIKSLSDNLSSLGYSIIEFNKYLETMLDSNNDSDIKFSFNTKVSGNVKLMNIHASKGLEFPICYFTGYKSEFNRMDLNNKMNFDSSLGFILPFYDEGIGNTIIKNSFKTKYNEEDISERIRLFYVSLTRAKEKMIIVVPTTKKNPDLNDYTRSEYRSFLDIIDSIKSNLSTNINKIEDISLTKKYNISKDRKTDIEPSKELIKEHEININNNLIETSTSSKTIQKLLTKEEVNTLEYGTKIHKLFETSDFYNSNNELIKKFIKHIPNIKESTIFKEYEFITTIDNKEYSGIIDLIIEFNDIIYIIDYKLKNISDDNYKKQLNIYKEYIQNITNKRVNTYLYSIMDDNLNEIDI